jgi:hypothetical protein
MRSIVHVEAGSDYRLSVQFDDGVEGTLDMRSVIEFRGVFAQLKDPDYFRQVRLNDELGVPCWPNGADLDADVLYTQVTGGCIAFKVPA